jgi:hypothetical protein
MMGVAFPAEDIEEAKRKQPAAIQSVQARKAKKKANKVAQMMPSAAEISYWDIHNWKDDEPWVIAEKFANKSMPNLSGVESKPRAAAVDEYDPFADD